MPIVIGWGRADCAVSAIDEQRCHVLGSHSAFKLHLQLAFVSSVCNTCGLQGQLQSVSGEAVGLETGIRRARDQWVCELDVTSAVAKRALIFA